MASMIIVLVGLILMVIALIRDKMRPGMILFSVVVLFLCCGILTPKEALEGFSNKGMITVALLFLISEGVRQSGILSQFIKRVFPQKKTSIWRTQIRLFPIISFISAFLNNTPVVVIFAPAIKRWAQSMKTPVTKFLMPLSYATILGGMCTLIGTSTNLVVDGMIIDAGYKGFTMFELGKVGIFVALGGIIYMLLFSNKLLPTERRDSINEIENNLSIHTIEAVIGPRFPGINKKVGTFNFFRHYGAQLKEIKRNGESFISNMDNQLFCERDTLVLWADESFVKTWGDSSGFVMLADGKAELHFGKKKKYFALILLIFMIVGATVGETTFVRNAFPSVEFDMFFFACITTIIMIWTKMVPPRKYTKYITWDILITIACAFAISKAMVNSGLASFMAKYIISMSHELSPRVLLAILFIMTNLFTELITNNAAAALSFPIAISLSNQLEVNPVPFFVIICIASSASFSTPIGYQTNLIVQGIGNYKFVDFVKFGLPLNILTFIITITLVPLIWPLN
ncbi:MAG: SLC13 family permease [Phocaeicola sp.]|uniref:SLC13 family permease n=1 Tax=Phocaeicola sp. TaxID=2773926 RepID=UPI003F9FC4AB